MEIEDKREKGKDSSNLTMWLINVIKKKEREKRIWIKWEEEKNGEQLKFDDVTCKPLKKIGKRKRDERKRKE